MSSVPHVHQNKGLDMIFLDLVPFTLHTISHSIHTTHNISFHSHYTKYLTPVHIHTQYLIPFTLHKISHSSSHTHTISHSIHTTQYLSHSSSHIHNISHSIHTTHNISLHSHYTQYLTPKCQRRKTKQEKLSPSMNSKCKCEKSMGFFFFVFFLTMHDKNWVIENCPYQRVKKTLNTHSSTPHTPYHAPTSKNHVQHTATSEQTNKQTKQCVFHNTRKILF